MKHCWYLGQTVTIGAAPSSDPQTGVAVAVGVVLLLSVILLLVIVLVVYTRHCKHGEPKIITITNQLTTSQPEVSNTEPAQGNEESPAPNHRTHLGSFIETIELPDPLGLNSQDKEVQLSSSVISNGVGIVVVNTAHSVRSSNTFMFEAVGLSTSNQQVAHV